MYPAVFRLSSYKEALISIIESKKQALGQKITYQGLAESCGMQKTYLSRVLRHDAHLSDDQLFLICEELKLDQELTDYLSLLWSYNRTQSHSRRKQLQVQVEDIQKKKTKTEGQIPLKERRLDDEDLKLYFLKPQFQVLHMLLSTDTFRGSMEAAANHLGMSKYELSLFYNILNRAGVLEVEKGKVTIKEDQMHLPESSPLFPIYRDAMRLAALKRLAEAGAEPYSFSAIFSCSEEAKKQIHHSFLDWLKKVKQTVDKSPSKKVFQMNFDLLNWS